MPLPPKVDRDTGDFPKGRFPWRNQLGGTSWAAPFGMPQAGAANAGHHPGGAIIASAGGFVEDKCRDDTSG